VNRERFRNFRTRLLIFLAVLGPGIITANVDNDAGGIYTYSVAGAKFGYSLLWTLVPITVALIVVQEMVARMGGPDPRRVRFPHHLHPHDDAACSRPRKHHL
jgi:Mn2+/Fe2+ NRAMP family transporter